MSVDPLAMQFHAWSTYNYVMGNPIMLIDPTGKGPTDWVSINGQMLYDSKVTDQKTATDRYGSDAKYRAPGYDYTSSTGKYTVLGENGYFTQDGNTFEAVDNASQSSTDIAWNTSGGVGSETTNPFLSNLRQSGNFDFNHVPIDFPETYDIAGPLANIFKETFLFIGTAGFGAEIGLIRAGLTSAVINGGTNYTGQLIANDFDNSKVDVAGVAIAFGSGFVNKNPFAVAIGSAALDASVDYSQSSKLNYIGKKDWRVLGNDFLWNGIGNSGAASFGKNPPLFETLGSSITGIPTNVINTVTNDQISPPKP